jgi:hypothetical protein
MPAALAKVSSRSSGGSPRAEPVSGPATVPSSPSGGCSSPIRRSWRGSACGNDGLNDRYRELYAKAHSIAPAKGIGWHIWHNNSFSPFYRAAQDYAEFSKYSDFLKVVMYNNCGGPRLAQYIRNIQSTLFADLTPEQVLDFTYGVQQYREQPLDRIPQQGLSADYVLRETRRAARGVTPAVKIWPGIDIDIPTGAGEKKTQAEDVYQAVRAAFQGGAHGVILSRKYSEMQLANLRAAGRAVRGL